MAVDQSLVVGGVTPVVYNDSLGDRQVVVNPGRETDHAGEASQLTGVVKMLFEAMPKVVATTVQATINASPE